MISKVEHTEEIICEDCLMNHFQSRTPNERYALNAQHSVGMKRTSNMPMTITGLSLKRKNRVLKCGIDCGEKSYG